MAPWMKKYTPKSASEIPQDDVGMIKDFIVNYKKQKKKGLLLYGPPGSCKSSSVYAIARELGLEIIETNASDSRSKKSIKGTIGEAMVQQSLFFKGKIILVDEVDGLSGTKDRGGIPEMVSLMQESAFPVICTANDPTPKKFSKLRRACKMVEFAALSMSHVLAALKTICDKEGIAYDESILRTISRRCGGDLRAAINDLETICVGGVMDKEIANLLGDRDQTEQIEMALLKIFKTVDPQIALRSLDNVKEDLDKVLLWIEYNIPHEYKKPEDLARAFEHISRANIFKARIMKRQHWRFLTYIATLLTAGIATAKDEKYPGRIEYKQTTRLLRIWQSKMKNQKRNSIADRISERTSCSSSKARTEVLPYLRFMVKNGMVPDLGLEPGEIAWLKAN
jgi:replication factor C large subunit